MGKIESLIKFTGRVDNVVGAKGKNGEIIIRKYQNNPTKSQTTKQVEQRTRFLTATGLANLLTDRGIAGFTKYAKSEGISLANAFVKANLTKQWMDNNMWSPVIKATTADDTTSTTIAWAQLELSRGGTPNVIAQTPHFDDPNTIGIVWDKASPDAVIGANDMLTFVIFAANSNPTLPPVIVSVPANTSGYKTDVEVPADWSGQRVHILGFETLFSREEEAVEYISIFNSTIVDAVARRRELQSSANYSRTLYMGTGLVA